MMQETRNAILRNNKESMLMFYQQKSCNWELSDQSTTSLELQARYVTVDINMTNDCINTVFIKHYNKVPTYQRSQWFKQHAL